jgi:hypothetical protein
MVGGSGLSQQDLWLGGKVSNALWSEQNHKYDWAVPTLAIL